MVVDLMQPKLCKAGIQFREQVDDSFPDRSRISDGWIGDTRHSARASDHNPDADGWVYAIDITADLGVESASFDLADQIRIVAKTDKRIKYVIHNGQIASSVLNYKWRKYTGINPHKKHIHLSFTKLGTNDSAFFQIPMLGGKNGTSKSNVGILGKIIPSRRNRNLPGSRLGFGCNRECCTGGSSTDGSALA